MKHEHQKHRMALEMLNAERGSAQISLGCLAHRKDEATGEATPDGLILGGSIPVKELTRWAARKGYLTWQRKDSASAPEPQPTETTPEPEVPKEKTRKVTKPAAKKTPKTTKEKKHARTGRVHRINAKSVSAASSSR